MINNVIPTKSNYIFLKMEKDLAQEGFTLLEQKREVLVSHLQKLFFSIQKNRADLDECFTNIFKQLVFVQLETGTLVFDLILDHILQDYEVDRIPYSVMGVVASKLVLIEKESKNTSKVPIGISGTKVHFDSLLMMTQSVKELMAEVAYLEGAAWKICTEIKKIQRRINALEKNIIPNITENMKFIKNTLEEKDCETLFQIKKVKEIHQKRKDTDKESCHGI